MDKYKYCHNHKSTIVDIKKHIGFQLFCHRHKYRITAEEVDKNTGISIKNLNNIEIGRGNLSLELINKILDYYNMHIDLKIRSY